MNKLLVLPILAFTLLINPVLAQTNEENSGADRMAPPVEDSASEESVAEKESTTLSAVSLSDVKVVAQQDHQLTLLFSLRNQAGVQPGVVYGVQLYKQEGLARQLVDTYVPPKSAVTLEAEKVVPVSFTYSAPPFLSGEYEVVLVAENQSGLFLASDSAGRVKLESSASAVSLAGCKVGITDQDTTYALDQRVDVAPGETMTLNCTVTNEFEIEQELTPVFTTHLHTSFGSTVVIPVGEAEGVSLAAKESRDVTFVVPTAVHPQSYSVSMALADVTGTVVSSEVELQYLVQGLSATVQNVILDKADYVSGDTAVVGVAWTATEDVEGNGTDSSELTMVLRLTDQAGVKCADVLPVQMTSQLISEVMIPVTATCQNPQLSVSLIDKMGTTLARQNYDNTTLELNRELAVPVAAPMSETTQQNPVAMLAVWMLVGTAALIVFVMVRKREGLVAQSNDDVESDYDDSAGPDDLLSPPTGKKIKVLVGFIMAGSIWLSAGVQPVLAAPSATISATNCQIAAGASTCLSTINWSFTEVATPEVRNVTTGTVYSTAATGVNELRTFENGINTVIAWDGVAAFYDATAGIASCVAGTTWDGDSCEAAPQCDGQTATIYVSGGMIVGGADDGMPYTGSLSGGVGDVIVGTNGVDTITVSSGDVVVCTLDGDDIINTGSGNDNIWAGSGDNTVNAGSGIDLIHTEDGIDTINAASGDDQIWSAGGADIIDGGSGDDQIWSGDGDDYIVDANGADDVWAGTGNDTICFDSGGDYIEGEEGDEVIEVGSGSDTINGGPGNDDVYYGTGSKTINGGPGVNTQQFGTAPACTTGPSVTGVIVAAPSCTILSGNSTCNTSVEWSSGGPIAAPNMQLDGIVFSTAASSSGTMQTLAYGSYAFEFYDGVTLLDAKPVVSATCEAGTSWTGVACLPPVPLSGSIDAAPSCTILSGDSTCDTTVVWSSSGLTAPSMRLDTVEFSTAPNSAGTSQTLTYGNHAVDFYDGATLLDSKLAVAATCEAGSSWDSSVCAPLAVSTGAINAAPSCTILSGDSTCDTTVVWSSSGLTAPSMRLDTVEFSTAPNSAGTNQTLTFGSYDFEFFDGATLLDAKPMVTATCALGTSWSGTACLPPALGTGNIDVVPCIIASGNSTCNASVAWSSSGVLTPSLQLDGVEFSTAPSSAGTNQTLTYGSYDFEFFDGATSLDSESPVVIACAVGTSWSGGVCTPITGDITSAPACTIASGASTCNVTVVWSSSGVIGAPSMKSNGVEFSTAPSSAGTSQTLTFGSYTFEFFDGLTLLDAEPPVVVACAIGSSWDGVECVPVVPISGSIDAAPDCTILSGDSTCDTTVVWSSGGAIVAPSLQLDGTEFSTAPSSAGTSQTLTHGNHAIEFYDGVTLLDSRPTVAATCEADNAWNGLSCVPLPIITIAANPTTIRSGTQAAINVTILANYNLSCTTTGATPSPFVHTDNPIAQSHNLTTVTLTAAQEVYLDCISTEGWPIEVGGTASTRVEVIPRMQEI